MKVKTILYLTMETFELYAIYNQCNGVSTDTRNITNDSLFFALKGENFDANAFALEAIEKGAAYAVVDKKEFQKLNNNKLIVVDDTLKALQDLAAFHRFHLGLPIIALTGSNGKTTTKELIHTVLKTKYNTIATIGNLNNHIGVPLTLLRMTEETDLAIIEMGANHQNEIALLCEITQPDFGLITNFGRAHLEGFGGIEGVIKGKSEMYDYLNANKKTAFLNFDDPLQNNKTQNINRYGFSLQNHSSANIHLSNAVAQPIASLKFDDTEIITNLTGLYNLPNISFAITVGNYFNVPIQQITEAISNYIPQNNRSQWIQKNNKNILLDAYNANPSSMQVAISNFKQLDGTNKLMILGDMFELGEETNKEHLVVIREAIASHIPVYFVGNTFFSNQIMHDQINYFKEKSDAIQFLNTSQNHYTTILIKGSRAMSLENFIEFL